jgi:RNA polymerase sigma-70 factor, ECF subfamily
MAAEMKSTSSGSDGPAFREAFETHRPELLRHCYRMMGSYAEAEDVLQEVFLKAWAAKDGYVPTAPMAHWLMRIATTTCLKALASRRIRGLPQLDRPSSDARSTLTLELLEESIWVTPAPDARMFPAPDMAAETRETIAVAFVALLQRLPPRQRAALLLKDVLGWSAEEIAESLELSTSAVNSALHRARETMAATPVAKSEEPPPDLLKDYIRAWETRDVEALVALLKKDVVLAMPPRATWIRGAENVRAFYKLPRFEAAWAKGFLGTPTRANGSPAVAWYAPNESGIFQQSRLEVIRVESGLIAESVHFVGADYLKGFDIPAERRRER